MCDVMTSCIVPGVWESPGTPLCLASGCGVSGMLVDVTGDSVALVASLERCRGYELHLYPVMHSGRVVVAKIVKSYMLQAGVAMGWAGQPPSNQVNPWNLRARGSASIQWAISV